MRGRIRGAVTTGLRPEEIRLMTPSDLMMFTRGWNEANEPKKPGSDAPTREEYEEMKRRIDGGH